MKKDSCDRINLFEVKIFFGLYFFLTHGNRMQIFEYVKK